MRGQIIGINDLGNPGAGSHVVGTGDYNGDGRADILFQSDTGQISQWLTNGAQVGSASLWSAASADLHVKA